MKHLIETENPSGLATVPYDRIVLDSTENDVIVKGGGYDANILMVSKSGYQLYSEEGDDGQINYWTFEYDGTETYNDKKYFKYLFADAGYYILAPTRNITKVTFPFDDYHCFYDDEIVPFSRMPFDSLYGFTSVPENKILMKPRTDIGTNANGKDYVDLGLTSGTLWATCNVGATSETQDGHYFMWGSTTPNTYTTCNWANAPFNNGSSSYNSTYFNSVKDSVCPNGVLAKEYDAASQIMGGNWRMPTNTLIEELVVETTNKWIENFNGSGVNGWKFISTKDTSKYIFIPASGRHASSSFDGQLYLGYIWSSSLYTSNPYYAWLLYFRSDYTQANYNFDRCNGQSVRGVL